MYILERLWNSVKIGGSFALLLGILPDISILAAGAYASLIAILYFFADIEIK